MFNWFKKKKDSKKINEPKKSDEISNQKPDIDQHNGPDYSKIDNNQKAVDLFNTGQLVKIYLMPIAFGGMEMPMNTLFVPEFVQEFKKRFDNTIEELLIQGKKISYSAEPEYKGKSFIPSKLIINVTGESEFKEIITIW